MYTIEDLKKYDYFDGADLTFVLDSLTGVISRQYILDFARKLVKDNVPFAMCMMDLDNFKYINDSYGHKAGDICLKNIADGLIKVIGDGGLVGRFGGDEFIILYLKSNQYEDIHALFEKTYGDNGAVRKFMYIENVRVFITATTGSASFPKDATDYNELFLKMDKALYRGKSKGRNCYIIYVHEKHKDIVVSERGTNSLLSKVHDVKLLIETSPKEIVIEKALDYVQKTIHPANTFFVFKNNYVKNSKDNTEYYFGRNSFFILDKMVGDKDILPSSNPKDIKDRYPDTAEYIDTNRIHAFVVARVANHGFIVLYENTVTRMWQDYDLVLLSYIATLLSYKLDK